MRHGFHSTGWKIVTHTGTSFGYGALLTLVPDLELGVYSSITGEDPDYVGRRILHLYILDLLMDEDPWLNATSACTFPEPTKMRQRFKVMTLNSVTPKSLTPYIGTYGNFAYGNITVMLMGDKLHLHYGMLGRWILHPGATEHYFNGEGQDHIWPKSLIDVRFNGFDGGSAVSVEVPGLDSRAPPTFKRGLAASEAPEPPQLSCPSVSGSRPFSPPLTLLVTVMILFCLEM